MSWRDSRERRDEVKAAFLEGHTMGRDMREPSEAWGESTARARLGRPLEVPDIPPTIRARDRLEPHQCQVGEAANRALGGGENSRYAKGGEKPEEESK